jgi:hypothetical protein
MNLMTSWKSASICFAVLAHECHYYSFIFEKESKDRNYLEGVSSKVAVFVNRNIAMSMSHRANKRRRRKPPQAYTQLSAAEERFLQHAILNSRKDSRRPDGTLEVPFAPTFYPTVEEMEGSPLDYVEKIRPQAQKYGICKIVPPKQHGWNPPFCKYGTCIVFRVGCLIPKLPGDFFMKDERVRGFI